MGFRTWLDSVHLDTSERIIIKLSPARHLTSQGWFEIALPGVAPNGTRSREALDLNRSSAASGLITGVSLPPSPGRCRPHDTQLLSLLTVRAVCRQRAGGSGWKGLALLRTAISREWLVLIALIRRSQACRSQAAHRPRLAPGPQGERNKGSHCTTSESSSCSGALAASGAGGAQRWVGPRLAHFSVPRALVLPAVQPAHV